MLEIVFNTEALTRVRFAISPTIEMVASTAVLEDPSRGALHLPWVARAKPRTADLDLSSLRALQGSDTYNPDFIHPLPASPLTRFEEEVERMVAIAPEQIRAEVRVAYEGQPIPAVLRPFLTEPRAAVERLAELMRRYWAAAIADDWERIRSLLEHDILYRARQIADGGTRALFADLDETVRWNDGVLRIDKDCAGHQKFCGGRLDLDDRGLLLIPSVFAWPKVFMVTAPPWQPALIYPARGIGMLWESKQDAAPDALARLLGRNRAAVLMALDCPRSTTELAGLLGVTSGGISQQLTVLAEAGLVNRRRVRRHVLYLRTLDGDTLVDAVAAAPA
jgi:DNA-binding transcriptional ArsR family regulator